MESSKLEKYWSDIPIGKKNAVTYSELVKKWNRNERAVRSILHDLSLFDNGDNFVLIRSSGGKGFYKTDNEDELRAFRQECLNKGKSVFAPVKKINRVLNADNSQYSFENNLRVFRERAKMTQTEVCRRVRKYDKQFDKSILSKMENGVCMPTPLQISILTKIYACSPDELIYVEG